MVERAIKNYYTFFDERFKNSTFVVLAIAVVIMSVGSLVWGVNAWSIQANTLHVSQSFPSNSTIIVIDGQKYGIELTKISE